MLILTVLLVHCQKNEEENHSLCFLSNMHLYVYICVCQLQKNEGFAERHFQPVCNLKYQVRLKLSAQIWSKQMELQIAFETVFPRAQWGNMDAMNPPRVV